MKVLYLVSRLLRSGPTRQLLNIVHQVKDEGVVPLVATLSEESGETLIQEFLDRHIEVLQLRRGRLAGLLSAARDLREICEREGVQIIHSQGVRADSVVAGSARTALRVATIRNVPRLDYRMTYGRLPGAAMALWHRYILSRLDAVVAVSESVAAELRLTNTVVVRNGVDTAYFSPPSQARKGEVRNDLGVTQEMKVFVSVGHLSKRKDASLVVDAFRQAGLGGEAMLLMIGDGPERDRCASLADGSVRLLGRHKDVRPFLAAADYFVSASQAEGFPNAVLEAAAMDLPLILSDIGPHTEIITSAGLRGMLFPSGDRHGLKRAFVEYTRGQCFSEPGNRQAVCDKLSRRHMGRQYADLYSKLIAQKDTLKFAATPEN